MSPIVRTRILAALGDATLILTVLAALPYSMGDAADVLGPRAKVWVTFGSVAVAGLAKFVQHAIQIVSAFNAPDVPTVQPLVAAPLVTTPKP